MSITLENLKEALKKEADKGPLTQEDVMTYIDKYDLDDDSVDDIFEFLTSQNLIDGEVTIDLDDDIEDELFEGSDELSFDFSDEENMEFDYDLNNAYDNENYDLNTDLDARVKISDPVKMYLGDIGSTKLLTVEEEIDYAKRVEKRAEALEILEKQYHLETSEIQDYLDGYAKPDDSIKPLLNDVLDGKEAIQDLASANLRLVVSIAKKYVGRGMLFLDLIQEGNIGLLKAIDKYDYTKGFKFSTYATWWIRQAITRAIADQSRTIRIPVHMVETINKIHKIRRQLEQELGREPSAAEIAALVENMTPKKIEDIQQISLDPVSFETPIGDDDDSTNLCDFVEDDNAISPFDYAAREHLLDEIKELLLELTDREEKVLKLRYGLDDGKTRTLEEVGKEFNVTRERIRQIEAKALKKLKHPGKYTRLEDYK